ncbi:kinase-like protein [Candidatus Koribacter versatilis Ellin345]|uniref:Kinase-like protein n=1 Tax=Koribacter versatilis (strain Ellin345) TaxID=204669 RepID=Q1INL1_KORVE|nr:ATP-binding protein [Candidatus Koribacter versatilis]ABF41539.1 kinase-like protein [Candidatus Koribacter versatilis Ellin345]
MRKWMRDRNKRRNRKTAPEQQGGDQPPPLQPSLDRGEPTDFPPDDIGNRVEAPVAAEEGPYQNQPKSSEDRADSDRNSRRRGRRGRGRRGSAIPGGQTKPTLPGPGSLTGEGAEADIAGEPVSPEVAAAEAANAAEANDAAPAPSAPAAQASRTRAPKGAVVLAIGLPGSGKSTWFKRHNIIPLSSDLMRTLLFDDVTEQRFQDLVFSTLRSLLRARMIAKRPWNHVDATNLSPKERRSWIKLAHDFGYEAQAVFFDVPTEVCIERNRKRGRNVPDEIIHRMAQKLRPPKFEEGFTKITIVKLKKSATDSNPVEVPVDHEDSTPVREPADFSDDE